MRMLSRLGHLHDGITDVGFLLSTLGLALMVTIYCVEVVARYFLGSPIYWANDFFADVLCVSLFAMVPHATRGAAHIEINLLPEMVPALRPVLFRLTALAGFVICGFVAWMAWSENVRQFSMGLRTEQNNAVPVWWLSSFITYAFAGSSLYFLRALTGMKALRPVSYLRPDDVAHSAEDKV